MDDKEKYIKSSGYCKILIKSKGKLYKIAVRPTVLYGTQYSAIWYLKSNIFIK